MAITVKKSPGWVPGQEMKLTGTGPGLVVPSTGGGGGGGASFVTSGLALHLDPGDPSSYSGSGNTWYDLSGNAKHATVQNVSTLTHDPTAGALTFAGGTWASGPALGTLTDWTIFMWARKDAGGSNTPATQFFTDRVWGGNNVGINYALGYKTNLHGMEGNNGSTSYVTGKTARSIAWYAYEQYSTPDYAVATGTWVCYAVVKNSLSLSLYVNGSLIGSPTTISGQSFTSPGIAYNINNDANYGNIRMNCSIGPLAVYNRGITSGEVTQNWNATRSRFGM